MSGFNYCYYGDLPQRERCCDCKKKLYSTIGKLSGICWNCFLKNRTKKFINNWLLNIKQKGITLEIKSCEESK